MLARRIIPTMLVRGRTLVKGRQFAGDRSIGHAAQAARVHARRQVDELAILDISATAEGRSPDLELVRELSEGCFIPISVGGGVKTVGDIDALLRAGADKVVIGTMAWDRPALIEEAADRFGSQAIVVSLDFKHGRLTTHCGAYVRPSHRDEAPAFAAEVARRGAGEILLQSVERDGTMSGYDLQLIRDVSAAVDIPVIASGGCRDYADMLQAFKAGADACAAGALYSFTDCTPKGAAQYLKERGLCVRI